MLDIKQETEDLRDLLVRMFSVLGKSLEIVSNPDEHYVEVNDTFSIELFEAKVPIYSILSKGETRDVIHFKILGITYDEGGYYDAPEVDFEEICVKYNKYDAVKRILTLELEQEVEDNFEIFDVEDGNIP